MICLYVHNKRWYNGDRKALMVIFTKKYTKIDEIAKILFGYIGGQIIHRTPGDEYFQAHLMDVTVGNPKERIIVLKVDGYCKLVYKSDDVHSCTIIAGTQIEVEPRLISLVVRHAQFQKKNTPMGRVRLYCAHGKEDVYFIKSNHPLSLTYDNTTLVSGPTQKVFACQMRERALKSS